MEKEKKVSLSAFSSPNSWKLTLFLSLSHLFVPPSFSYSVRFVRSVGRRKVAVG